MALSDAAPKKYRAGAAFGDWIQGWQEAPHVVYAVPDLHGHLGHLCRAPGPGRPGRPRMMLVLLGDYIDRGPDSLGVLELVSATQERCPVQVVALLGNHDLDQEGRASQTAGRRGGPIRELIRRRGCAATPSLARESSP